MNLTAEKILCVDDDVTFLNHTKKLLDDFIIVCKRTASDGIRLLRQNFFDYSAVMVDLDLGDDDFNGVRLCNEIHKINPFLPIIFVSANLSDAGWAKKISELRVPYNKIKKPFPMITSSRFAKIVELIKKVQMEYCDGIQKPFSYSYDEFVRLSDKDRSLIFQSAHEVHAGYIEYIFETDAHIDWVCIGIKPGQILRTGTKENELSSDQLADLAAEIDGPVFAYSRPRVVESIDNFWSQIRTNPKKDYYPTLAISLKDFLMNLDFDTGSWHTFLSYEHLRSNGLVNMKFFPATSYVWGVPYNYFLVKNLKGEIFDSSLRENVEIQFEAELVKEWSHSPFVKNYDNRIGLVGRNVLIENKLKILLDAEACITYFVKRWSD